MHTGGQYPQRVQIILKDVWVTAVFKHVLSSKTSAWCLNRRDYPGTTFYGSVKLKTLSEGDANDHTAFFKARGVELAIFFDGLIDSLSLPGPTADGKEGGPALMGWSLGNLFTLGTVASASSQPQVQNRI